MNYVVIVEIVNRFENLFDCLRSVFFRELAVFTDAIKQLSTGSQLSDDVVFILC